MPILKHTGQPDLHYELDDYTGPWRHAPAIVLHFAPRHDGTACHEP